MNYDLFKEHLSSLKQWNKYVSNWYQLVLMRIGLKKSDFNLKLRNGLKMTLMNRGNDSDTQVVGEIWFQEIYNKFNFCDLEENAVVLDLGANVGIFSLYISNKNKTCKVYSYEASALNYNYLQKNITINNLNIFAYNYAVTAKDKGMVKLHIHPRGSGGNTLYKEASKDSIKYCLIPQINLDKILKINNLNKIDLLKMDIEGSEYEVLFNTSDETFSKINKFVLEIHDIEGYKREDLILFLRSKGFCVEEYVPEILYGFKQISQKSHNDGGKL